MLTLLALGGCTGGHRGHPPEERPGDDIKIEAEAFRFNSRVYRDGKPTTFRTEIYLTERVIGLAGTGYFGKGAFRGRITTDSALLYFPHSNEYVQETVEDLLFSASCVGVMPQLELRSLLTRLPTELELGLGAVVEPGDAGKNRRTYTVRWIDCPWRFDLTYDLRKPGWRLRDLRFDDGSAFELALHYDRYKPRAEVKLRKLRPRVPRNAVRLEP